MYQASLFSFHHWDAVAECHMVIVTVNSEDTDSASRKLVELLNGKKEIPVFSLQRGVRNSSLLKDE